MNNKMNNKESKESKDWTCKICNYSNFKRNTECRKCKEFKNQWTCFNVNIIFQMTLHFVVDANLIKMEILF